MGKERKCILCEMVCSSKQEMDDHMRSMLHHRELEKLKGRDCGHECKVCQVTVVSLTDYAGHISSSLHKQNVEASERQNARNDRDVEYFDQTLVDLIEKRKESIRKQEEEAAAQRAREEAEKRRQQDFQQRLAEAKERFRLSIAQKHPWALRSPKASGGAPCRPGAWNGNSPSGGGTGDHGAWVQGRQGKSATWHAQQAPNFRSCEAGGWGPGGSLGSAKGWGGNHWDKGPFPGNQWDKGPFPGNQWDKGPFPGNKRGRHPWLSNRGSSNGVYGRNNIPQYPQLSRPVGLGPLPSHQAPPNPSPRALGQTPNQFRLDRRFGGGLGEGHHNGAGPGECNPGNNVSPKTFGSNPKLDKVCRWSPYPPTKLLDPVPQKEPHPGSSEKLPQAAVCPQQQRAPDGSGILDRCSQVEGEARHWRQGGDGVDGKKRQQANKKKGEASGSGSREATSSPGPSKHKADRKLENSNRKWSLTPPNKTKPRRNSTEEQKRPKSGPKATGRTLPVEPLQSRQEQQLSVTLDKSREAVLERRGSADQEAALPVVEEPQRSCPESQAGADKENKCSQAAAKMEVMDSLPDSTQYLQSVQVSTSTKDVAGSALSGPREDEKAHGGQAEEDGGRAEWRGSLDVSDEATRAGEARHSSESDASRGASEVQNPSAVGVPGLTQLGLPPVLKRDLTKHISCKSKTAGREPNLNIARRVRNVSESRKGDSEKESGLKPTVRQLLSSTGSRRNVNWEQVYEEVRKKQGQGKGLPRFGIEMVSCDQEEHSQEDEDMTLLEGFHWDSLMGSPITPRKRSLSESSVAPTRLGSCHDLFARQTSGDSLPQADVPSSDEQDDCKPAVAPRLSPPSSQGTGGGPQQPDEERGPRDSEAGAQGPAGGAKKGRVRVLQRSDSALGDCSSGTELYDAQGMGKKRRAAGDIPIPDISSLQRKNKRMKMKSKKERFQVDQLLAVSLREEQLSLSLQTLDTNLIQAKSALQTAYMEVQHIMLLKQQVATEMSALRNQRIELLKGMQVGFEDTPASPTVKEEMRDLEVEASNAASSLPYPCTPCPTSHPAPRPASPPSCGPPRPPVGVKQEPMSPVHVSADLDPEPMESLVPVAPTSPPEPSVPPLSTSPLDTTPRCSPEQGLCPDQAELSSGLFKDGSLSATAMMDRAVQADQESLGSPLDSKLHLEHFPSGRRSPESGRRGEVAVPPQSGEHPAVSQAPPLSPSALRGRGKRVRRLRKRRSMNKTQGGDDEPGSSNTEADEEASRPRRLRPRRRSSGGSSQVSTSTPPAAPEEDEDEASGVPGESCECAEVVTETLEVAGPGEEDLDSALEMVVLPSETVNIDTSEPEENMEVGQACQQPVMEFGSPGSSSAPDATWRPLQNLASNEVTSTSDMDVYGAVKPYQSDTQMPLASAQMPLASAQLTKVSSDTSSDPGGEELPTEGAFQGHQEAVNGMQIHGGLLYTCSGDRSVRAFNLANHTCVAVFEGHSSKVNCLLVSAAPGVPQRLYSGSSDQTICCYNLQTRLLEQQYSLPDRVLCLHSRWKVLYAGLANGTVVTFNLKTNRQLEVFDCHGPRAVSCLASAQEGALKLLLVGSFDSTISVRDARNGLLLRTLEGHTKTVLCMKVVNDLVFSGSCDQSVHAHNIHTGELVRIYKGHRHAVTVVAILGKVMVTASLDKLVRVYELQSHARLQVYGGHKDMVMCMVVHKSMIYTGCYDGSVQAVKLNLMQNHRCVWSGCSLIFGVQEHLQQHLMDEHANPSQSFQTLRCRWKNCNEVFCAQTRSQQGMFTHMQKHLEETS